MPEFIYQPPTTPIKILYQDDSILVADKPAGLLSVPGRLEQHKDSLVLRMQQQYGEIHCVHRLDMDTSGIMLMATNKLALSNLSKQFQQRTIGKIYRAVVWGKLESRQGQIDEPLITDWPNRPRQKICYEEGKKSLTKYKVIVSNEKYSELELYPITGRSHQLRIHLQSIGHPILGCRFYAHPKALQAAPRLLLHASYLSFSHPVTGEKFAIDSPENFPKIT
jgi:tRNA pseudouridine32 synthase/23S rRNA pseudouridine746 synthase